MEVNVFFNYEDWNAGKREEPLDGEIIFTKDNMIIETYYEGTLYKQLLSFDKIFAVTQKMQYSFGIEKELNIYLDKQSWVRCKPQFSLHGFVLEEETTPQFIVFIYNGYKHIISASKIFAFTYEA